MKISIAPIALVIAGMLAPLQLYAESLVDGSVEAGKARSLTCTACHGQEGISMNPMWPNIAGQNAPYLEARLKYFRDGVEHGNRMNGQAAPLSDEDIATLSGYFSRMPR